MGIQASSNSSSSAVWSNTYLQNCADDQQKKVGKSEETRREGTLDSLFHSVSHDRFLGPLSKVLEFLTPKDFASFVCAKDWKVRGALSNCTNFNYKQLKVALAIDLKFRSDNVWKLDLSRSELTDDQLIDFISRFPKVRSLDLSRCHAITDKGIEQLGRLSLLFLDLTSCWKVTGEGAKHLRALPLKHLNLSDCTERYIQGILENIRELPLETLNLSGCFITENYEDNIYDSLDFDAIELISSFEQLKSLDLTNGTGLRDNLSRLHGLPLEYLNLSGCCSLYSLDLRGFTRLKHLELYKTAHNLDVRGLPLECLKVSGWRSLADSDLRSLTRLKHLELQGQRSSVDLRGLPIEHLSLSGANSNVVEESNFGDLPLLSLDLSCVGFLDDISFVSKFSNLETLDLAGTAIKDAALTALRGLRLKKLCLRHTAVTNAGLKHLSGLPLRSLDLRCSMITKKGAKDLKNFHSLESLVLCVLCIAGDAIKPFETLSLENLDLRRCSSSHLCGVCKSSRGYNPNELYCLIQ